MPTGMGCRAILVRQFPQSAIANPGSGSAPHDWHTFASSGRGGGRLGAAAIWSFAPLSTSPPIAESVSESRREAYWCDGVWYGRLFESAKGALRVRATGADGKARS